MMNPVSAVGRGYGYSFNFPARASRSEFWWFMLWYMLAILGACAYEIWQLLKTVDIGDLASNDPYFIMRHVFPITAIVIFGHVFTTLSLSIRRLHDIGFSGWWYLLSFVPFGSFVLLILAMFPSEKRPNKWGPVYGEKALPGAEIFSDVPVDETPEIYKPGNLLGPKRAGPALSTTELQAARKAEIDEYYKSRVLKSG